MNTRAFLKKMKFNEFIGVGEVSEIIDGGILFRYNPKRIGFITTYEEGRIRWNELQKPEDKEVCQLLLKDKIKIVIKTISEEEFKSLFDKKPREKLGEK